VQKATTKPVTKIPTPIVPRVERTYRRADFGLPDDRFLFLFSFDFNAFPVRKNPEAVLIAFHRAFPPGRKDVGVVIKSINGRNRPDDLARIEALIGGDPRIVLIDRRFTRDEVYGLQQVADCYISLHRAEGLGLGLAESMYFGKPAIATRYSGNLEFMNAQNSCLVDFRLIPVAAGSYPVDADGQVWADPDVEHAAHWMRRLVDDVEFRTTLARRGQHDVRSQLTHANAAALMRGRLEKLGLL
jgi:glycosyltransferase involved in cell wall biosynthesis